MKQLYIIFSLLLVLALFLLAPKPLPAAGPVTLKLSHALPQVSPLNLYSHERFAREVERRTNGRVKIEVHPSAALGKPTDFYDMTVSGICDLANWIPGYKAGFQPSTTIGDLPLLWPNAIQGSIAARTLQQRGYFDKDFADVKLLWISAPSPYHIWTSKRKVTSLEDVKGLKLRAFGEYQTKIAKKLGITAATMPAGDVFTAIQTGVLDGTWTSYELAFSYRHVEVCKYVTEIGIFTGLFTIIMNKEKFSKLSPGDQNIIDQLGVEYGLQIAALYDSLGEVRKRETLKRGIQIVTLDETELKKWQNQVMPIYDEWASDMEKRGYPGKRMMTDLREIQKELGLKFMSGQ